MRILLLSALLLLILFEIPVALLPPTARDALIYHLAYPKLWLQHGKIFELPFAFYSYYPRNTEILFAIPLYFGMDSIAAVIHMAFGLLTSLLIYKFLKIKINKTYAMLGALIFLSTPIVIKLSTIPYVDLALAFNSTGAVLALLKWKESKETKWLILSGVLAGLAAGTKYNGLFIPLLLSFMTLHISRNSKPLRSSFIFISISAAVAFPWYIKNFIQTGNPFAPLFFNMFGGVNIPDQPMVPIFLKRHLFYGEDWLDILLIPLRIFFHGQDDNLQYFDGVLNPILLIFLPFVFRSKDNIGYLGLFSLLYFLLVYFTADMQIRFLLPILPMLAILTVIGIKALMEGDARDIGQQKSILQKRLLRLGTITIVVALLSLNFLYLADYFTKKEPIPYLTGKITRDEYLLKNLRGYDATLYINKNLPANAKVLMIYTGDRGYYIDRDYYYNSYLSGRPIKGALEGAKDAGNVSEKITGMGITHILMDERLFGEFIENNMDERQKELYYYFLKGYLKELHASEGYRLYEVRWPTG